MKSNGLLAREMFDDLLEIGERIARKKPPPMVEVVHGICVPLEAEAEPQKALEADGARPGVIGAEGDGRAVGVDEITDRVGAQHG
jgi:hypothetical protein